MKRVTLFLTIIIMTGTFFSANAVMMSGTSTVRIYNDNTKAADAAARSGALQNALQHYFGGIQENQPEQPMPSITPQFFRFIRSYRILDRHCENGAITYSVTADIEKVSMSDVAAMMRSADNSAVFVIHGITDNPDAEAKIASALSAGGFSTSEQSSFRDAAAGGSPSDAFQNSNAKYMFDIQIEPVNTGTKCSAGFTVKVYSKSGDFTPIKVNGDGTGTDPNNCLANAAAAAMPKIVSYVRSNYVPTNDQADLTTVSITASNYSNFAVPKNLMEDLKKKSIISSYNVKNFAEKSLDMDAESYISEDMLLKKLQALAKQYNFTASKTDDGNILLDFSAGE